MKIQAMASHRQGPGPTVLTVGPPGWRAVDLRPLLTGSGRSADQSDGAFAAAALLDDDGGDEEGSLTL